MCLAVPMKIIKKEGNFAQAECGTLRQKINIEMLSNLKLGDYCIVHAGFAIEKIDKIRAQETLRLIDEIR